MAIKLDLNMNVIKYEFKAESDFGFKRHCEGFRVQYTSGKRVYITAISEGMNFTTLQKNMRFEDNGNVELSFGKDSVKIGEYATV